MVITPLRFQIEVRYNHILDFRNYYKSVVGKYLSDATFIITNPDQYEEEIQLTFRSAGFVLTFRWDRIVVAMENKPDNFFATNGPLFHFFDLIAIISTKTEFTSMLFAQWNVIESNTSMSESEEVNNFIGNNLKHAPSFNEFSVEDSAVVMNYTSANNGTIKLQYGPFKPVKDIQTVQNNTLNIASKKDWSGTKGILTQVLYSENTKNPTLELFKKADKKIHSLIKDIIHE